MKPFDLWHAMGKIVVVHGMLKMQKLFVKSLPIKSLPFGIAIPR
jgi:hypothetical protein